MRAITTFAASLLAAILLAGPSVFPTGTTIYDPAKAFNGYTVLSPLGTQAAVVIDMNGREVKRWDGYSNSAGGPSRVLPGGYVVSAVGAGVPGRQESQALVQRDFDGKEMWRLERNQRVQTKGGETVWALRQHHDWQRADWPAGYYSPEFTPAREGVNVLVLSHTDRTAPKVTPTASVQDDRIVEYNWAGEVQWEWMAGDHIDEMRFDAAARQSIATAAGGAGAAKGAPKGGAPKGGAPKGGAAGGPAGGFDWLHLNSADYVGPNKWFDQGDARFNPRNVIVSSREASLVAVISRADGKIVWQVGPDFFATPEEQGIGQIIGQHMAHFIPKGLPGAGNVMIFDNGGPSGYGAARSTALKGRGIYTRATSRVVEIDPVTKKLVWSYTSPTFFATNISGAQRLANGNTLITEGPAGRIFEVTPAGEIVWEYVNPLYTGGGKGKAQANSVYRAYRLPYEWIPQLTRPQQRAVTPPDRGAFRVP